MPDNVVTFIGTAGEPELRFTPSGLALFKFGLALYGGKNDDGTYKDSHWVNVVVWDEMAQNAAESIEKGDRVFVTGRIQQRRWETDDGDKRSMLQVTADEIGLSCRWTTVQPVRTKRSTSTRAAPRANPAGPDEAPF